MIVTVKAWLCRLCGHIWLITEESNNPAPAKIPDKCARCRKRHWQ
jgi:hypothetical protein